MYWVLGSNIGFHRKLALIKGSQMKWISLLLLILLSGTLLAIPPMPEWIQPDQEKKKTSGSSTVSSRTFVIKLEEQNTIIDQQPVDWDYKPSCASFLKCKFADGKDYDYWPESYVRKSYQRLNLLVEREKRIGIREDVRRAWLLKKR